MSISNHLNKIKNAVFGKDVRGAIHDAIKQCYDDASINHDNANMEVKLARGTHDTLNDRLNKSDELMSGRTKISVKEFGARGDGLTDDTSAIQNAIDYCINNNCSCYFPNGIYMMSKGIETATSHSDVRADRIISIEGESRLGVMIEDLNKRHGVESSYLFNLNFNKKVMIKNIATSTFRYAIQDPNAYDLGEEVWALSLRDKDFYLENLLYAGDGGDTSYYLYINAPAPDSYDRYSDGNYAKYPLEITNGSGYNAININNFSTNADGSIGSPADNSAIGIVDRCSNSTGVIFIDMMGQGRSFERYVSREAPISSNVRPQTVWEVHRNGHIAIGCSVDEEDFGWNTIKVRDYSPSIRFIDARNDDKLCDILFCQQNWGEDFSVKIGDVGFSMYIDKYNRARFKGFGLGGFDDGVQVNMSSKRWDSCLKFYDEEYQKVVGLGIDRNGKIRAYHDNTANNDTSRGNIFQLNLNGRTDERPTALRNSWEDIGVMYFDKTLNKPIWWSGINWVDSSGNVV